MIETSVLKEYTWESAKEAFETMVCLPIERTDENIALEASQLIICIITYGGPMEGAFTARCTTECASKMARAMLMLGEDDPLEDTDVCDAFGEVVNMLIGGFKTRVNDEVPDIQISIPSVVKGLDIEPTMGKGAEKFDIGAMVDGQAMKLTVMFRSKK